ncbi:hypothetical protein EMPS_02363 [Entomortierella parvispora]|uniref:Condensin complex subunit 1 C-terminal domain-containing protein n=1 Tax=Entomortierella parvispora TaxID=205924 RepID=A0A9P3LTK3_9FUNG|nr:hypothetical protein EMPS_02363 [Entomortierella parvispora]
MLQPLNKGFQDKNAYVRNTAAMASISLFELDPLFVLESEIIDRLYGLLRDRDPQVVISSILALETILVDEGGIVINNNISAHLLKRYKEWSAPQLQVVLSVLCRFQPHTDDEIYDIMNDVDDGVQNPSLAVQMATLRLFIWICQDLYEIQGEVYKTIEETLIKQMESRVADVVYATLRHLQLLVESTGVFRQDKIDRLSTLFIRAGDPSEIQRQKINLCTAIAIVAPAEVSLTIVDHLQKIAALDDITGQLLSTRGQLDRHIIAGNINIACHAVESIARIACEHYPQTQATSQNRNNSSPLKKDVLTTCLDVLFRLVAGFSGIEDISLQPLLNTDTAHKISEEKISVHDLGLEDFHLSRLLSSLLTSIEGCWQRRYTDRANSRKQADGALSGVLDASQIKTLGILLLRHLDQDELDRLSKLKKPLRFSYNSVSIDQPNMSASISSSQADDIISEDPKGLSRIARINGIRILLFEEFTQQMSLRKRLESERSSSEPNSSESVSQIEGLLQMRTQYALLLQQQVQDIVQSMGRTHSYTGGPVNDRALRSIRVEQLSALQLACHLVALSLELDSVPSMDDTTLVQRTRILAQTVASLIPVPLVATVAENEDLLQLHSSSQEAVAVEAVPSQSRERTQETVSRDVADRARLIESIYLRPLSVSLGLSLEERSSSMSRELFDSPLFKTEAYQLRVKQAFIARFGTQSRDPNEAQDTVEPRLDVPQGAYLDWQLQMGFNTTAVVRERGELLL